MSDFFSKMSRAVDAFTDILAEDIDSKKNIAVYKYDDFRRFVVSRQRVEPRIKKCTIAVNQVKEFDGMVFPEMKYLIRVVLLDEMKCPIPIGNSMDELMGDVIIASSIDTKLRDFMGDKKEKTVSVGR